MRAKDSTKEAILNYVDLFGQPLVLEDNGSATVYTFGGLISTAAIIITVTVLSFLFGKDLYKRDNPQVNVSSQINLGNLIYLKEFPIVFKIWDSKNQQSSNLSNYLSWNISRISIFTNSSIERDYKLQLKTCDPNNYIVHSNFVSQIKDSSSLCINNDKNDYVMSSPGQTDSVTIEVDFYKCNQEIDINKTCATDDEIEANISNFYIQITFLNDYLFANDYLIPINKFQNSISTSFSKNLFKKRNMRFSRNVLQNDVGWLLTNVNNINFTTLDYTDTDYYDNSYGLTEGFLVGYSFGTNTEIKIYSRQYMKIQDLLANISGIYNFLYIVMNYLTSHYTRFKYMMLCIYSSISLQKEQAPMRIKKFSENPSDIRNNNLIELYKLKLNNEKTMIPNSNPHKKHFSVLVQSNKFGILKNKEDCVSEYKENITIREDKLSESPTINLRHKMTENPTELNDNLGGGLVRDYTKIKTNLSKHVKIVNNDVNKTNPVNISEDNSNNDEEISEKDEKEQSVKVHFQSQTLKDEDIKNFGDQLLVKITELNSYYDYFITSFCCCKFDKDKKYKNLESYFEELISFTKVLQIIIKDDD